MSTTKSKGAGKKRKPGGGRAERYIQPSVLLALKAKPSYGYELIQEISGSVSSRDRRPRA